MNFVEPYFRFIQHTHIYELYFTSGDIQCVITDSNERLKKLLSVAQEIPFFKYIITMLPMTIDPQVVRSAKSNAISIYSMRQVEVNVKVLLLNSIKLYNFIT